MSTAWWCRTTSHPCRGAPTFPIPRAGFSRQSTYGCGFWNADLDWASGTAVPAINSTISAGIAASGVDGIHTLDVASLFSGHELCAATTQKLDNTALADWRSTGAADISEWINEVRTASTAFSDYYIQESLHPNYWGQLALRNCLRQVYNDGDVRSGSCTAGTGLTVSRRAGGQLELARLPIDRQTKRPGSRCGTPAFLRPDPEPEQQPRACRNQLLQQWRRQPRSWPTIRWQASRRRTSGRRAVLRSRSVRRGLQAG